MADNEEEAAMAALPQKRFYRQRAHSNPLADRALWHPPRPQDMDWAALYPDFFPVRDNGTQQPGTNPRVEIADVGCGYGGLLVALSPLFPHTLSLGLELRLKVWDFTRERIRALRAANPGRYQNVACVRANAMKHLPHLFRKGQLSKMFFLFPDPHFKRTKHRWRIVSTALLADYGYVLRPGGLVYTITDVPEVHDWMLQHFRAHPLFQDGGATRRVGEPPPNNPHPILTTPPFNPPSHTDPPQYPIQYDPPNTPHPNTDPPQKPPIPILTPPNNPHPNTDPPPTPYGPSVPHRPQTRWLPLLATCTERVARCSAVGGRVPRPCSAGGRLRS
ncbi:tRNA (guanine-N(7)-)-methyltransferase [Coturnix japonica]|uniref:tRNA (guanine-N(7)-)-methyltransferase n=1 Tax=Coturnix japonica TaxID=93934 RepID=UPI0013A5C270|nr:tRNA (guanine-N(7)-)-methyltransferase [Coturnix japonica]